MRRLKPKQFIRETDLCAAFISWAMVSGAKCFPEWAGWDILVILESGEQVGIQAKLRLSDEVILQALQSDHADPDASGPDFRAILVPEAVNSRASVAHRLGLVVFDAFVEYGHSVTEAELGFRGNFRPRLDPDRWFDWGPTRRHGLPETETDSIAGSPSPVRLTSWKRSALTVLAELEVAGRIHSKRMRELGVNPCRWTQGRWIEPTGERGVWKRGEACPAFDKQHPSAFALALERAAPKKRA